MLRCNLPVMNSWHSWSPNSKWIVFTSKANSPYTELYLTHIDDRGESSPAIRLFRIDGRCQRNKHGHRLKIGIFSQNPCVFLFKGGMRSWRRCTGLEFC